MQLNVGVNSSRAESVLNQFGPVHLETFGGRLTQILYGFVGLAPIILMMKGVVMWWWYRRKQKGKAASAELVISR